MREFMMDALGVMAKVFIDEALNDGLSASNGPGSRESERMGDLQGGEDNFLAGRT